LLCPHSLRYDGPGAGGRCKTKTGLPRLLGICRELAKWGHNIKSDYGGGAMTVSQAEAAFNIRFDGLWPDIDIKIMQFTCMDTKASFYVKDVSELPDKIKEVRAKFGKD